MAGRFRPVAAAGHLAPAPLVSPRVVEEDPAAGVVGTDPGLGRLVAADRPHEWLGELGQGAVDLIAGEPAGQAQPGSDAFGRGRLELEDRAMAEDAIDLPDR